jgi:predicted transcriptional regulator
MARQASKYPTELELEILKVLWQEGACSVSQVRKALVGVRDLAHTSVMTVMSIMTDKGYVARTKQGNRHIYRAVLKSQKLSSGMLGDLVNRLFNGSAAAAMVNLLETSDLDTAELTELKQLILSKEKESKS